MTIKVYDFRGEEITAGSVIAYAARRGSSLWLTEAEVISVSAREQDRWPVPEQVDIKIKVKVDGDPKARTLTKPLHIVVVKGADSGQSDPSPSPLESQEKGRRGGKRSRLKKLGPNEGGRQEDE